MHLIMFAIYFEDNYFPKLKLTASSTFHFEKLNIDFFFCFFFLIVNEGHWPPSGFIFLIVSLSSFSILLYWTLPCVLVESIALECGQPKFLLLLSWAMFHLIYSHSVWFTFHGLLLRRTSLCWYPNHAVSDWY